LHICSVSLLAKSLHDIESLALISSNSGMGRAVGSVGNGGGSQQHNMLPLFSRVQEGRLDSCIAKLEDTLQCGEIHDVSTSAVMELYEYKLAANGHSERALQVRMIYLILVPFRVRLREFLCSKLCSHFFHLSMMTFYRLTLKLVLLLRY